MTAKNPSIIIKYSIIFVDFRIQDLIKSKETGREIA
jgi:hypothetical protein